MKNSIQRKQKNKQYIKPMIQTKKINLKVWAAGY